MNKIIKHQLENCRVANVPVISDDMNKIFINKIDAENKSKNYQLHKCYLIELEDYLLNPPEDYTVTCNWNNGTVPKYKYYKAEIANIIGKMVKINGFGYNTETKEDIMDLWEGWVPQKDIHLIREL